MRFAATRSLSVSHGISVHSIRSAPSCCGDTGYLPSETRMNPSMGLGACSRQATVPEGDGVGNYKQLARFSNTSPPLQQESTEPSGDTGYFPLRPWPAGSRPRAYKDVLAACRRGKYPVSPQQYGAGLIELCPAELMTQASLSTGSRPHLRPPTFSVPIPTSIAGLAMRPHLLLHPVPANP